MKNLINSFFIILLILVLSASTLHAQDFWEQTNGPFGGIVLSLAINSTGHIFAGAGVGVFLSTDNGDTWTGINTGLPSYTGVSSLAINSTGHIFAGTFQGGVFRSTDNGDTWTQINTGLTNLDVRSLAINSTGHIFAGTNGGAFRSTDNGDTWTQINTGLTNTGVSSLAINSTGHIFTGTFGSGVFRGVESTISVREITGQLPSSFSLGQNYPNPFNPLTIIEYSLPRSGDVSLIIYNLLGEEVARLVDGFQQAGEYNTNWNAANVASGVYFYRLQAGDFVRTRKMVYLK